MSTHSKYINNLNFMDKKEEILNATIKILQESNYHNMKISKIAEKLNIAEGTIYNYFTSKRELFVEAIEKVSKNLLNFFIDIIDSEKKLKENLEILASKFLLNNKYFYENYKVLYKAFSEVDDEIIRQKLSIIFDQSINYINEKLNNIEEINKGKINKDKIRLIILFLWGIGDIAWKKFIISNKNLIEEIDYELIINVIYSIIKN